MYGLMHGKFVSVQVEAYCKCTITIICRLDRLESPRETLSLAREFPTSTGFSYDHQEPRAKSLDQQIITSSPVLSTFTKFSGVGI